jgi:hypothetical protein
MTQTQAFQKLIDLAARVVKSTTFTERPEDQVGAQRTAKVWEAEFEALAEFLYKECPKPLSPEVCVEIKGGVLQHGYANKGHKDLTVILRDFDNIDAGDADPLGDADASAQDNGFPERVH